MEDLVAIRRHLHQHPEVSRKEKKTQQYLLELLEQLKVDDIEKVADTGLLVTIKGKSPGKNILLRTDIDALPIQEENDMEYRSENDGASHKCGHDGHATIMCGVAENFTDNKPEKGNVYLLFQPAEEIGWGARAVNESGALDKLQIDYVFALHNLPGHKLHKVVCRAGSFTPGVTTLIAKFKGYTAHAAEPWNGRNPAHAMSRYTIAALKYNAERPVKHEFVTVAPVYTVLGEPAYGTSAGEGSVHLTIRADSNERLQKTLNEIKALGKNMAKEEDLEISFEEAEPFESNQNDENAVTIIESAAKEAGLEYEDKDEPFRWGEDFGLFTNRYPGAMFGLGSGEDCKPLHHPAYDFPDELIETGIKMFTNIQSKAQQK